jgi:hypothetical protein
VTVGMPRSLSRTEPETAVIDGRAEHPADGGCAATNPSEPELLPVDSPNATKYLQTANSSAQVAGSSPAGGAAFLRLPRRSAAVFRAQRSRRRPLRRYPVEALTALVMRRAAAAATRRGEESRELKRDARFGERRRSLHETSPARTSLLTPSFGLRRGRSPRSGSGARMHRQGLFDPHPLGARES